MEYTKPELNVIGVAETLVLGNRPSGPEGIDTKVASSFEFEE
jgi:hypothetical protein